MTTTKGSRRLGIALAAALVTVAGLLVQAPAGALPTGAKKTGMVCSAGTASAGPTHIFNLTTGTGDVQTPDGNSIFMWSYADRDDPNLPNFQYPGPVLCVTEGEQVVINLHNTLPEASSIVFPGQAPVTATGGASGLLTTEAAPGGDVSYSFTAGNPGTYLYESGSNVTKQIEMGLYGALVVRPSSGPNFAYNNVNTQFDTNREYLLLLAEIDPDLHHAVETGGTYDFTQKHDRYFTINGRSFPDTILDNGSALLPTQPYGSLVRIQPTTPSSQPALIRLLNAGSDNHPFHPHGNHTTQIAQDGRPVARTEHFGETIGSGQTEDFLLRWDNNTVDTSGSSFNDDWNPATNPIPVAQPNYRNLTFKDGTTWYSGSPYLGYKGTLPTGTNSLNVCGEWYFPFHSHALNEFSNFDAGFGGMGTLLRVDPAGGCFASPTSVKILQGTLGGGSVTSLAADDATYYKVKSKPAATSASEWYGQFSGVPSGTDSLKVSYKGNNALSSSTQSFDTLASSGGASSSLPTDWYLAETGGGANTTYAVGNGSSGTANTYSFGATGSSDRAFGGLRGTGGNPLIPRVGSRFTNTTGGTITSLTISYTGEQWRHGGGTGSDRLDFQYSTNATSLTTGSWTDVNSLDFTGPVTTGVATQLDGNASANRTLLSSTIAVSIPNGAPYWIRWTDFDRGGSSVADDGLAVDDFSLTPGGTPNTTVSVWNWTTSTWTSIAGPVSVGAADVTVANSVTPPGSVGQYIGTGANKGLVRVRVLSTSAGANFVTGGNLMRLVYDAP